jgi:metallo-beta-lactamase family protein
MAKLTFLGAAETVTGSRFFLEAGGGSVLVDCGLFQGLKRLRQKNWEPFPIDVGRIDAVVLTHAHIDHSGYLPRLYKLGYRKPVYCTPGTAALVEILLPDAAHLQEEEAEYANRKGYSKHHPAEPLYTTEDAMGTLSLLRTVVYTKPLRAAPGIEITLHPIGHLLGAGSAMLAWSEAGATRRLLVSGDIGKYDGDFMDDPQPTPEPADYLLIESTYGDRVHHDADVDGDLAAVVNAAIERGGVVVVPAFAIGRTQELLFHLARLERTKRIPVLDVYVDSPMAVDSTHRYLEHREDKGFEWYDQGYTLRTERTHFVREVADSKKLRAVQSRAIIISASGMATGGRILHHMSQRIGDPRNTILFCGYQADGTRGRKLIDGADSIRIFGEPWPVRAKIENLRGLSAHADSDDLVRWAGSLSNVPRRTWVVHGEGRAAQALSERLRKELHHDAAVAMLGESVELS